MVVKKTTVKSKVKKTKVDLSEVIKNRPDFESQMAEISKDLSEKVQNLVSGSGIEAIVRVSFSFNTTEGEK